MIRSFKHKGLELYYKTGRTNGIQAKHAERIRLILARLNVSITVLDMNLPGLYLHKLSGKLKSFYSVKVGANWRIIFRFSGQDVFDVDYLDYH